MKALRYLLILVAMMGVLSVSAQTKSRVELGKQPDVQMHSTSAMVGSGSVYMSPISNVGAISPYATATSESSRPKPQTGIRRVGRDDDPGEPGFEQPIGDAVWFLLILSIGYVVVRKKKSILSLMMLFTCLSVSAEGYESMANITKQTYEWTDVTNYTGDNGMAWRAVGARDSKVGGYNALTLHSSVPNNGLSGALTTQQIAEGVGKVSFMVKGMQAGTGYGNRTFRVTAGSKSVDVTMNVPSMTSAYRFEAKVDATGASTLAITMLASVENETAAFCIYNIQWTSFNGKTDTPTFSCNEHYIANGADTTWYTEDVVTINLASTTPGAVLYYTIDGSEPSTTSTQSNILTLGVGTHIVKAMAWTASQGESDIATKIFEVRQAAISEYDASNTAAAGEYETTSASTLSKYTTLSGLPFYKIGLQKNHIITDAVTQPLGFSLYAKNTNNRTLTVAWQAGNEVIADGNSSFEPTTEWTDIQTISTFSSTDMKRFEVLIPAEAQNHEVRFRIQASGTSVYLDDIIVLSKVIERASVPSISHVSGELQSGTEVTLTPVVGTTLHYSINNAPELISTAEVVLNITEATTLEVYATQDGKAQSPIVRVQYTIAGVLPEPIHPTSIEISKTELSIVEGQRETLTATVLPANADDKSVIWSSNNTSIATVSDGEIIAIAPGNATIIATTIDGGLTATCAVTVTPYIAPEPIHPESITLNKTEVTLVEGAIASLKVTILPANAENKSVIWSSDNEAVATVSDGTVTAVSPGTANITATTVDGSLTAQCYVVVTKNTPTGINETKGVVHTEKLLRDGQVLILRNGEVYTVTGMKL